MTCQQVHVIRAEIQTGSVVDTPFPTITDGQAILEIEGFALTANNVTYAATGEIIGYWKFFPVDDPLKGIVPVWGYAHVIKTRSPHVAIGDRFYGFFPMATHLKIQPEPRGKAAIIDAAPHRAELPPTYNAYMRASPQPPLEDARKSIFYPLLLTSYLLFDFLKDNDWFSAEQVIIGSASSKTGLGLAKYLSEARPDGPKVIGLTSPRNRQFVSDLGTCDQVVTYDDLERDIRLCPSVYVDMAGDTTIRSRLHHHLGDQMLHSAAVGTSHWDKFVPTGKMPGARPRFFFAPSQVEKRRADWGAEKVQVTLDGAWKRVADDSGDWMNINISDGLRAALAIYRDTAASQIAPNQGHYIAL